MPMRAAANELRGARGGDRLRERLEVTRAVRCIAWTAMILLAVIVVTARRCG